MKKPPYKFSGIFLKTRICCWLLTAWCLLDFEVSGEVIIRIIETAVGVEIDGEGSINVEGLKLKDEMTIDSIQNPLLGSLDFAVAKGNEMNLLDVYFGLSGPPFSIGVSAETLENREGDLFGIDGAEGVLLLPSGYGSGEPIRFVLNYPGSRLDRLGLEEGMLEWHWGDGIEADSVKIEIKSSTIEPSFPLPVELFGASEVSDEENPEIVFAEGKSAWVIPRMDSTGVGGFVELPSGSYKLRFIYAADPRQDTADISLAVSVIVDGIVVSNLERSVELGTPELPGWKVVEIPFLVSPPSGTERTLVFFVFSGGASFREIGKDDGSVMLDDIVLLNDEVPERIQLDSFGSWHGMEETAGSISVSAGENVSWLAKSNEPWVRFIGEQTGVGDSEIRYWVEENSIAKKRSALISIGGKNLGSSSESVGKEGCFSAKLLR